MRATAFVLLATATACNALAPTRSRLPVQRMQRSRRSDSSTPSMRFGKKQLVYRSRVKKELKKVQTMYDLAEVIEGPEFYLANRRMSARLLVKM